MSDSAKIGREIVEAVHAYVAKAMSERDKRLDALKNKQGESLADMYRGGWGPNNDYRRGDVVNHHSALWLCMSSTTKAPGSTSEWRLLIKGVR